MADNEMIGAVLTLLVLTGGFGVFLYEGDSTERFSHEQVLSLYTDCLEYKYEVCVKHLDPKIPYVIDRTPTSIDLVIKDNDFECPYLYTRIEKDDVNLYCGEERIAHFTSRTQYFKTYRGANVWVDQKKKTSKILVLEYDQDGYEVSRVTPVYKSTTGTGGEYIEYFDLNANGLKFGGETKKEYKDQVKVLYDVEVFNDKWMFDPNDPNGFYGGVEGNEYTYTDTSKDNFFFDPKIFLIEDIGGKTYELDIVCEDVTYYDVDYEYINVNETCTFTSNGTKLCDFDTIVKKIKTPRVEKECNEVGIIVEGKHVPYEQEGVSCLRTDDIICCWDTEEGGMNLEDRSYEFRTVIRSGEYGMCQDLVKGPSFQELEARSNLE